jgi:hypothetical protein
VDGRAAERSRRLPEKAAAWKEAFGGRWLRRPPGGAYPALVMAGTTLFHPYLPAPRDDAAL